MVAPTRVRRWLRAVTLRTLAMFVIAAIASIGFVWIAAELKQRTLDQVDVSVELAIHRLDSSVLDAVMKGATLIGSDVVLLPAVGLVALLAARRKQVVAAVVLIVDASVVLTLDAVFKSMFARERPRLFAKIALPTDYSFPSGHAMSAMGVYGVVIALLVVLYPRLRRALIASGIVLIAAIGCSRVYLGVHWPSDVLGGFLGGLPPLLVSIHLLHRRGVQVRNAADLAGKPS